MVPKLGLYAYGILGESPKQLNILGIDKKNKVYPVQGKDIWVMVSKIDTDKFQDEIRKSLSELAKSEGTVPEGVQELLRTHEEVVNVLMKLATVVPFRFGTILKNENAASKMLLDYGENFKRLLAKFMGREEWGIKVYIDDKKFKKFITKSEPKLKKQASGLSRAKSRGAAYLLGRKMEEELKDEVATRLAEVAKAIFQEAGKNAYESQINKTLPKKLTGKDKEMILNSAYLVEIEKVANFRKQVKSLIEKYEPMGLEIAVSGPWPPYSFT